MIKSIINEYGSVWIINRLLYSSKLKMMSILPFTEKLFDKKFIIKRINIFDINVFRIKKFLLGLPEHKKREIIAIADKAASGKIKIFSSIELDYGDPIKWNYNPITKEEIGNNLKWYKIPDFDSKIGDIKIIWEASRLTHFFYFARAYLITKDERYYNAFSNQLRNWVAKNRYPYGPNYKCGQEATLRMINVLIVYSVFKSCGFKNALDENNIKKLVEESYKKVLSNFFYAHKCIKNNHTLSEIAGLIIGAWCTDNKKRLINSYRLLDKEIINQFLCDGGYIQYSFNYQRFALQVMEFLLKISNKTRIDLNDRSKDFIKKSVLLMYQLQDGNGDMPNYGPNDGALIFPLNCCDYRDFKPVLNTTYALLNKKRLYNVGDYDEELLWFVEGERDKYPIYQIKKRSSGFGKSGLYSLRSEDGFLMVVLQNFKTRPSHMDQLHIDVWHKGRNILCDSGTYSYADNIGKQMSLTLAHNTAKVDDKEQMRKYGSFFIYDWPEAKDIEYNKNYFKGTMISKNGYLHTRLIKKTKNGYLIEDTVKGYGNHCEFNFHTPFKVRIIKKDIELLDKDIIIAKLYSPDKFIIKKSHRSLYYLRMEKIDRISIYKKMKNNYCHSKFEIQLI
jgi:hypothetical protein